MNIWFVLLIIFIVSILLAIRSFKHLQKMEKVKDVTEELKKGKVIFQNDSVVSSSPDSSSSSLS